jgi:hypothetical protein
VFIRVDFLSQQGALSAKYGSIASEKQRSCGEKETEEIWRNLGVGALGLWNVAAMRLCTKPHSGNIPCVPRAISPRGNKMQKKLSRVAATFFHKK